jgi:hypothetical protein
MKVRTTQAASLLVIASMLLAANGFAQTDTPHPSANVPPPPGMNDPGVKAVAPAAASTAASTTSGSMPTPKPQALPSMQDNGAGGMRDNSIPEIKAHQRGDDLVEEYSRSGQVYMIVVTPKTGVPQTYMVDPQGRVTDEHGQKPVHPVMYKVLEWGKAKPAEASSTDAAAAGDDSH